MLYDELVTQFNLMFVESFQPVVDFRKIDKLLSKTKKDTRYYEDVSRFVNYMSKHEGIMYLTGRSEPYGKLLREVTSYDQPFDLKEYKGDLKKSPSFLQNLRQQQSIEFSFSDTIFILTKDGLSRQSLTRVDQTPRQFDYRWFLKALAIDWVGKQLEKRGQQHGLVLDKAIYEAMTRDIFSIDIGEYNNMRVLAISNQDVSSNLLGLASFIFDSEYLTTNFNHIFWSLKPVDTIIDRISFLTEAIKLKITEFKDVATQKEPISSAVTFNLPITEEVQSQSFSITSQNATPLFDTNITERVLPDPRNNGLGTGAIIGVAVGSVFGLIALSVVGSFFYSRWERQTVNNRETDSERGPLVTAPIEMQETPSVGVADWVYASAKDSDLTQEIVSFFSRKVGEGVQKFRDLNLSEREKLTTKEDLASYLENKKSILDSVLKSATDKEDIFISMNYIVALQKNLDLLCVHDFIEKTLMLPSNSTETTSATGILLLPQKFLDELQFNFLKLEIAKRYLPDLPEKEDTVVSNCFHSIKIILFNKEFKDIAGNIFSNESVNLNTSCIFLTTHLHVVLTFFTKLRDVFKLVENNTLKDAVLDLLNDNLIQTCEKQKGVIENIIANLNGLREGRKQGMNLVIDFFTRPECPLLIPGYVETSQREERGSLPQICLS